MNDLQLSALRSWSWEMNPEKYPIIDIYCGPGECESCGVIGDRAHQRVGRWDSKTWVRLCIPCIKRLCPTARYPDNRS